MENLNEMTTSELVTLEDELLLDSEIFKRGMLRVDDWSTAGRFAITMTWLIYFLISLFVVQVFVKQTNLGELSLIFLVFVIIPAAIFSRVFAEKTWLSFSPTMRDKLRTLLRHWPFLLSLIYFCSELFFQ